MAIELKIIPTTLDQLKHMLTLDLSPFIDPSIFVQGIAGTLDNTAGEGDGEQAGAGDPAEPAKRRGRPPGSGKKEAATAAPTTAATAPTAANSDAAPLTPPTEAAAPTADAKALREAIHPLMDQYLAAGGKMNPLREIVKQHGSETGALSGVPDNKLADLKDAIELAMMRL